MTGSIVCLRRSEKKGRQVASLSSLNSGAGDESRTRDLNLGKVALYQLSYSRVWRREAESNRRKRICNPVHSHFAIAPFLERETSLELSTSTLARLRSIN